jgi:hypothetical protein
MSNLSNRTDILPVPNPRASRKWLRNGRLVTAIPSSAEIDAQPPLGEYFNSLFTALGPQHWWPGKTPFEVIVGAILTQNTSWKNAELALGNLRAAGVFTQARVEQLNHRRLQSLVRPAGYFRQKARALKAFVRFLRGEYGGSLKRMFTPNGSWRDMAGSARKRNTRTCAGCLRGSRWEM